MTSTTDDMREGKGRVHPGPSPSTRWRMQSPTASSLLTGIGAVMVLLAGAASSVFGTQAHQYSAPSALALVAAVGAFLGAVATTGLSVPRAAVREWLPEVFAGAAGFALAPWLVMANRYTDAPPGSEVVFFTTASWGAMLALAVVLSSARRVSRTGGILLALAGAAAVVANWERPSSFSPFVRYAREELFMLLAGILWVALVLVLLAASRRGTLPGAALRATLGGIGGALVLAALAASGGNLTEAHFAGAGVVAFGISTAFATAGALIVLRSRSALGIASAYLLIPATMSLLLLLEQVVGVRGPNPLVVGPLVAAAISTVAGLAVLLNRSIKPAPVTEPPAEHESRRGPLPLTALAGRVLASLSTAAALATLAMPGMTATVRALRADGSQYEASFGLHGFEVAGSWLALAVAIIVLGLAFEGGVIRRLWLSAAAVAAAAAAWILAAPTPLRTLTSFIPSDVQVDYGSEFARIDFTGGPPALALFALCGALLAVAVTLTHQCLARSGATDDRKADSL